MDWTALREAGCDVRETAPLREFTTFRLGGPCRVLITCETPGHLELAVRELSKEDIAFHLIGGGSNLLVADEGVHEAVVRFFTPKCRAQFEEDVLSVDGSMGLDELVQFTIAHEREGLVFASGIPGTVGGAIAGNAGAFGQQIGDRLVSVTLMDRTGKLWEEKPSVLELSYRHSRLHHSGDILVSARLRLSPGDREVMAAEREKILQLRRERHPDWHTHPTAGSFFRNVEPSSAADRRKAAGWFLEQAGVKKLRVGGAHVFEKHANIIVADGDATARDVFELSKLMANAVREKFSLDLVREVRLLGDFDSLDKSC